MQQDLKKKLTGAYNETKIFLNTSKSARQIQAEVLQKMKRALQRRRGLAAIENGCWRQATTLLAPLHWLVQTAHSGRLLPIPIALLPRPQGQHL
jgi:hypothetical protein